MLYIKAKVLQINKRLAFVSFMNQFFYNGFVLFVIYHLLFVLKFIMLDLEEVD